MAVTLFLHFLALIVYGVVAIRPETHIVNKTMVKLNLANTEAAIGLEASDGPPSHPPELPAAKLQAGNAVRAGANFSGNPVDEIFAAKPPVDIELADLNGKNQEPTPAPKVNTPVNTPPIIATIMNEKQGSAQKKYLELLQNTVQQKGSIPAEAAMNNIKGKAVLRLEFDRKGYVKHYDLKQSTGNKMLDSAATGLGKKLMTEPLPAPPASFYPNQKMLKFDFGIDYDTVKQ